jgi:hypothetical protein
MRSISVREADPMNLTNVGLDVGEPGNGNVEFVVSADAINDVGKFAAIVEINSKTSFDSGGIMIVAQSDTWAVGIDVLFREAVDDNNGIKIYRDGSNLICEYRERGNVSSVTIPSGNPVDLFTIGMSWKFPGIGMQAYYNGMQYGSDQPILAAIVGNLDITKTCFFSNLTTLENVWSGKSAFSFLWNTVPAAADHAYYSQRLGV